MWFERKNISQEEAKKEYKKMLALEEREDDEFMDLPYKFLL